MRAGRWRAAWLAMESDSGGDLDDEDRGHEKVHGGAERRPPPCAGNVVAALLPPVLEAMAGIAEHEEPRRSGDGGGGKQDEGESDAAFDGDDPGPSVCHREPM